MMAMMITITITTYFSFIFILGVTSPFLTKGVGGRKGFQKNLFSSACTHFPLSGRSCPHSGCIDLRFSGTFGFPSPSSNRRVQVGIDPVPLAHFGPTLNLPHPARAV